MLEEQDRGREKIINCFLFFLISNPRLLCMVKFPAYSKPVCLCLSWLPMPSLSAHFILSYSLKSSAKWKKCIISIFKRQKRLAEIGLPHYQGFSRAGTMWQRKIHALYTNPIRDPTFFSSSWHRHKPLSWYQGGQIKAHTWRHIPLSHADIRTSDDQSKFAKICMARVHHPFTPYQVFSWRKPLWFESPVQPYKHQ